MAGNGGVNAACESGAVGVVGKGNDAGMGRLGAVQAVVIAPVVRQDDPAEFDGAGQNVRVIDSLAGSSVGLNR